MLPVRDRPGDAEFGSCRSARRVAPRSPPLHAGLEDGPARALRDARRALFTAATLDPSDHRARTCLTLVDALLADGHSAGAAEFERALSRVESERRRRNSALAETLPGGVHIFVDPLRGP
jgi:hypothetical protein